MRNTLIDAGPCIALFNRDDKYHESVKHLLNDYDGYLTTTWPVITEVVWLLKFSVQAQVSFLEWMERGGVRILLLEQSSLARIIELYRKYADLPMDLADASLIVAAESLRINDIITIDSDYYVYRTKSKKYFKNLLEPYLGKHR